MILIGQYDSPFVRRVAIAMRLYGLAYEHRPWSVFRDTARLAEVNPLIRVPTLVADDGEVLIDSAMIIDALDDLVGPSAALTPQTGPERRRHLKACALACGLGDKAVSLVYEREVHGRQTAVWVERCRAQIAGALNALEADNEGRRTAWWFGDRISHADIAAACVLRFVGEALPGVFDAVRWPRLAAHAATCETLPVFQDIQQPFYVASLGAAS